MIVFLILVIIICLLSKLNEKVGFWKEKIIQQPFNYYLLIGLLIVGFFLRLDYSDRFGCIVGGEAIFELKNILFSAISIALILLSFFSKKKPFKISFISLELLFWTAKLFLFKGGYNVGIGGEADTLISFYDATTLALRVFIINSLLKTNIYQVFILIFTIIVMSIKIYVFPLPYSFYVEEKKLQVESEYTKNFLTKGEWIECGKTTEKTRIVFFPDNVIIYNFQNNDSLSFSIVSWNKEYVFLQSEYEFWFFEFQETGKDTLNVNLKYNGKDYKTQMTRKLDSR